MNHFTNPDGYNGIVAASLIGRLKRLRVLVPNDRKMGHSAPEALAMSIGGVDTVLTIPAHVRAAEVILRVCLQHWPNGVLEDDFDGTMHTLSEAESRLPIRQLHEFFVYRDAEAAEHWESEGATSTNVNTMLHFLISKLDESTALREVTLVCDQLNEPMQHLLADLTTRLQAQREDTAR